MINRQYIIYTIQILTISVLSFFVFKNYTDNMYLQNEIYYIKSILQRLEKVEPEEEDFEVEICDSNEGCANEDYQQDFQDLEDTNINISSELDSVFKRFSLGLEPIQEENEGNEESRIEEINDVNNESNRFDIMFIESRQEQQEPEEVKQEPEELPQESRMTEEPQKVRKRKYKTKKTD